MICKSKGKLVFCINGGERIPLNTVDETRYGVFEFVELLHISLEFKDCNMYVNLCT